MMQAGVRLGHGHRFGLCSANSCRALSANSGYAKGVERATLTLFHAIDTKHPRPFRYCP